MEYKMEYKISMTHEGKVTLSEVSPVVTDNFFDAVQLALQLGRHHRGEKVTVRNDTKIAFRCEFGED